MTARPTLTRAPPRSW